MEVLKLFLSQFKSPVIIILLLAAAVAFLVGDRADAGIITVIVGISGSLGFWQEKGARDAVVKLLRLVQVTATVVRNGQDKEVPVGKVVAGDIVKLTAGDIIPGDCQLISAKDLFVDQAGLTGETFPVEKAVGDPVYLGTHVVSGQAQAKVITVGKQTKFGQTAARLAAREPETEFERGIRRFGYLLMTVTLILVLGIFAVNVWFARPVLESLLFALALAVGLTPELLPVVISINLAKGAKRMAAGKVIVKRLASIENFGSMNILCADKTGTLTEGKIQVEKVLGADGRESDAVWQLAFINSSFETGFHSPIDQAIRIHHPLDLSDFSKLDEIPYDFVRKRLSVLVQTKAGKLLITKGALANILEICPGANREKIKRLTDKYSRDGMRILAVASKKISQDKIDQADEQGLTFAGFLVLSDPVKDGVTQTLANLQKLGVGLKIITGDNQLVARALARKVGLDATKILTGQQITKMEEAALVAAAQTTQIFAQVEPNQKEQIILALRKGGNVVGFLGDGINDAPALHAADVGISVNTGVDVAKQAASIVLLHKDLHILKEGIVEGRRTFANTMKYIFMATSANFGNMFSMAGASLFLPFLPLLPGQILFLNLLTDFPEMTIASDNVDAIDLEAPRRWDISFIRRFMLIFGPLSSAFDYLTFALLLGFGVSVMQFRTGWFLESVISAAVIVLVIRSRKFFLSSRPSIYLLATTLLVVIAAHLAPYLLGPVFGFKPLPIFLVLAINTIIVGYMFAAQAVKSFFYARIMVQPGKPGR
ncbi:MAG: magnesium-translocating P-type ATPase [Patescibacteria group bacterium]|nr:magnesium-translocating P-type ATPase [Patescibacteria group bacterium]MCL5431505.1 magnesium-translocating P-type ATPase [Patescibacteria group bacterium]